MTELERKRNRIKSANWIFWVPLVLSAVYQSYRYPLQINASGTSPTYSDTPLALQVGKFVMVLPFFALAAASCLRRTLSLKQWMVVLAVQFLFFFALFKSLITGTSTYLETSFWIEVSLVLAWASKVISLKTVDRFFIFLLVYALGSDLIELLLYMFFGRLPALAYENSFSVRFGGFLDDPNGFAAILFLLMGWSYGRFKGKVRALVLTALTIALFMTQSWTAIIFFAVLILFWMILSFPRRPVRVGIIFCVSAISILFVLQHIPDPAIALVQTMMEEKQGSADQHRFPWAEYAPRWTDWILQGSSDWSPYEVWWAGALINFGAPWILTAFAVIVLSLYSLKAAFMKASADGRPIYLGLLLFGTYFLIGALNLPFPQIFPINIFFFAFSFLLLFKKIEPEDSSSGPLIVVLK